MFDHRKAVRRNKMRIVPGLNVAQINAGAWAISARGLNGQFSNELLVLVDGRNVYTPSFGGVFWDLLDLPLENIERIEVIRGPGGTVWGNNAVNGVINIITKQPTNRTDGFAEVSFGNYGQQRYSAGIRMPIIKDKLFLGVSGLYDHNSGFYTNAFTGGKFDARHSFTGQGDTFSFDRIAFCVWLNIE